MGESPDCEENPHKRARVTFHSKTQSSAGNLDDNDIEIMTVEMLEEKEKTTKNIVSLVSEID